ncbi:MAG: hypothetical protein GY868_04965 [Deltaproteobacteria bacterium]|nr:hypothetical protein [Deltaproteobacteria bacterium]
MAWTPYVEKMTEQLQQLGLVEEESIDNLKVYSTEKAEKVAVGSVVVGEELHYGMCTIIPNAAHVLPLFFSRWEERRDSITMLVDLMPTVDSLVDEPYRVKYLESMGKSWDRFAALAGICPEEDDALRSLCSIIYTGAVVPIEKEGMRLAALAPHTDYLKQYIVFMQEAGTTDDAAKIREVERRIGSVRAIAGDYLERTKAAGVNGEKLVKAFL